ncbi:MAG: TolC family protein [Bacillota bacterium]
MSNKFFLTVTILFFLLINTFPAIATNDQLTLSEAKKLALENHPDLENLEVTKKLAEINEHDAWIAYENARSNYISRHTIASLKDAMDAAKSAYDQAQYFNDDTVVNIEQTKKIIEYSIEKLFINISNLNKDILLFEENIELQKRLLDIERKKLELGMNTSLLVEQNNQELILMNKQFQTMKNQLREMQWELNRSIGRDKNAPVVLAPITIEKVTYQSNNKDSFEKAKDASLSIEQYKRTIADKNHDIIDKRETASDKVEKLQYEVKQNQISIDDKEFSIEKSVIKLRERIDLAQKTLIDTEKALKISNVDLNNTILQFNLGIIAKINLQTAELANKQSKLASEKAEYDYYLVSRELELAENGMFVNG